MIFPFSLYQFLSDPMKHLLFLQKKYGDPFPLSFAGVPTIWLTADSSLAREIFTAPADSFKPSENNPVAPLLGPEGLIMLSGKDHLLARKELSSHFSKNHLVPKASIVQDAFWDFYHKLPSEGTMSLQRFAQRSTLSIILTFLFPHLSNEEFEEANTLTENFLKSYSASFLFIPKWVPGTWSLFNHQKKQLDDRFYEFFLNDESTHAKGPMAGLKDLSKSEVLDHIRTFIVAGHETSATSLAWTLYYLHRLPYLKNRLTEELMPLTTESILSNQLLEAVINEALRIHPPVPFVTRKIITQPFFWGKDVYDVDEEIGVCLSLLHRQEKSWTDASEFHPERFLEKKYTPFEYAPFGGGNRKCIGAELAMLELKILTAHFLVNFKSTLLSPLKPTSEVLQITIGPRNPIDLAFSKIKR